MLKVETLKSRYHRHGGCGLSKGLDTNPVAGLDTNQGHDSLFQSMVLSQNTFVTCKIPMVPKLGVMLNTSLALTVVVT